MGTARIPTLAALKVMVHVRNNKGQIQPKQTVILVRSFQGYLGW